MTSRAASVSDRSSARRPIIHIPGSLTPPTTSPHPPDRLARIPVRRRGVPTNSGANVGSLRSIWNEPRVTRVLSRLAMALFALSALPLIGDRSGSTVGELISDIFPVGRATHCVFPLAQAYLIFDGTSIISVEPRDLRFDQAATSCTASVYRGWPHASGIWAPTQESRRHWVRVDPLAGSPTPAQLADARAYVVSTLDPVESGFTPSELAALATADIYQGRTLWWGHAHNAFSLSLLVASIIGWTRASYVASADRRALARIAAGLCPRCVYSRVGLDASIPCPECGAAGFAHSEGIVSPANGSPRTQSLGAAVDDAPVQASSFTRESGDTPRPR